MLLHPAGMQTCSKTRVCGSEALLAVQQKVPDDHRTLFFMMILALYKTCWMDTELNVQSASSFLVLFGMSTGYEARTRELLYLQEMLCERSAPDQSASA